LHHAGCSDSADKEKELVLLLLLLSRWCHFGGAAGA
jgi:hypothetical protein